MSRALGGTIGASPQPEIGWQPIEYTSDPAVADWFGDCPSPVVIHWHYETFSIPQGAALLASSAACPNQAWAFGKNLAMQFHIEIDEHKAQEWAADEDPKWAQARENFDTVQDSAGILAGIGPNLTKHQSMANHIYRNWLKTTEWAVRL